MEVDLARRLWSAVRQGDVEAARKCLDSGADVAIKDESGDTPLHHVSKHGSLPMAKVLLDAGANPDAANDSLQTPLQYASERGKVDMIRLLFESKGLTPVQTASTCKQRPKTALPLLKEKTVCNKDNLNETFLSNDTGEFSTKMEVDLARRLWSAVRQGDVEAARKCLDSGADVAIKDESGDTPLHHVSMHGSLPMAKVLLDAGANPDAANDSLQTPLQYASERGKVKITRLLFESKGLTPVQTASTCEHRSKMVDLERRLWSAVRQGDAEAARKCLDSGADVAIKDESGDTPLHYVSKHGSLPMAKVLLDAGANPDAANDSLQTPLQYASERGKVEMIRLLFESKGLTPVQTASTYNHRPKTVLRLHLEKNLCKKVNLNETFLSNDTEEFSTKMKVDHPRRPWSAVRQGDAEAARKCIDSGADVAIKDESGDTPLHHVSMHGSLPMAKVLLDAGANPDAANDSLQTPLQYASESGKVKITKLLFESKGLTPFQTASTYKQRPKTVSKNLITNDQTIKSTQIPGALDSVSEALSVCVLKVVELLELIIGFGTTSDLPTHHLSAARGSPEGVDLPFEKSIDPDAENRARDTPLYLSGGREIVSLLATVANIPKSSATYEALLDYARNGESSPALEALDVSLLSQKGNTRLHIVCLVGHTEAVDILLENDANPNSSTESGHTPLHYASLGGFTKIVQRLIDVGADVNAVDRRGCTALHYAASVGHISAVEELVRCGADLQILSDAGKSVLHYASFYGRLEVVQRLVIEHPDLITFRDNLKLSAEDTAHIRGQVHSAWWLHKQAKRDATYKGFHGCRMDICKRDMLFSGSLSFQCTSTKQEKNAGVLASSVDFGLCEIHFQDQQGRTLLHAAAEQNNLPNIRILLERGALPTALTFNGKTPSDLAREKGHLQAYNMISSNYICETKGSPEELFVDLLSLITETAYYNAYAATTPHDLESTDASPKGQNPSLSAVRKASSLLTSGAPLEPPGSHTCYPLHLAITANCTPLLPLLLAAGAPLTATRDGLGPVQLAWLTPDITTWVAVLVTRAVRDRIAMEMHTLDDALQAAARALLEALDGERPWEAALERPAGSSDSLDALLFRAARGGASTLAWWIWNSGGSAVSRHHQDATPLHAALDEGHLGTARALALHMGGNLFLPDTDGRPSISLMSSEIIQESLAREYTILEQEKEKAKNSASCREVFEEALLLLVLCLEFNPHVNSPDYPDERWRTVLAWVLSVHGNGIASEGNRDWIQDIFDNIARILPKENVDNEAIKQAEETEESDYKVLLESISKIHQAYWREFSELSAVFGDVSSGSLHENNLDTLLKSAMIKACEKDMPLFLHLLTCVAGANVSEKIDEVCGGFPLHYAALHNNMSAARYILSQGASPSVQDRFGNTPAHYAYMFGHQEVGDFLKTDIKNSNGLPAESMLKGYNHYLKLYKLDSNSLQKRKMQRDNTASQIIQEHLQYLRRIWMENSISQAVQECHVDFRSDETRAIKKSVSEFIQKLILSITTINPMYKGDLQMLGSSEDNVRLFCPDEFDFNIIIQNMNINFPVTWKGDLRDGSVKLDKALNELLLDLFYCTVRQCLVNCEPEDRRLAIVLPGVKKTQVGVSLSLVWTGEVFPLLLVDVDVVATARASWPPALRRPKLTPSTLDSVYLNSIGNNEWRFSFALAENAVMKSLTADKRRVFLACKMVLSALKVEKWAPRHVQNQFKYFHGRFFKIPSPKGFLLKNTFFLELEEVTDEEQWTEEHLVERMTSVFRRMCEEHTDPASQETSWEPAAVKAYFADLTQSPCVGFGAPEILNFLKSLDSQLNQFQLQSNRKRHRGTYEYTLEK